MAKRSGGGGKKSAGKSAARSIWGKIFSPGVKKTLFALVFILLGGLLFNLDRMGNTGVKLLKYEQYLPRFVTRFLPGGSAQPGQAQAEQEIAGQAIKVYDGDTITVLTKDNRSYRIRFYGIDAPEAAQTGGIDSRDALREKILGKEVVVKVVSTDRYGRAVGKVMLGGRYINQEMVAEGRAWYYRDFAKNEYDLEEAERNAREKRLGIWSSGSDPQPPWEWRKENKKD